MREVPCWLPEGVRILDLGHYGTEVTSPYQRRRDCWLVLEGAISTSVYSAPRTRSPERSTNCHDPCTNLKRSVLIHTIFVPGGVLGLITSGLPVQLLHDDLHDLGVPAVIVPPVESARVRNAHQLSGDVHWRKEEASAPTN